MSVGVKPGVSIVGIRPEMAFGAMMILDVFNEKKIPLVFTACTDGVHGKGSLHYVGKAVDIRLPSRHTLAFADDAMMVTALKEALGSEWDVVLESDHIHVEHDPKVHA